MDPHNQEDEENMKQALDEAENSPDEDVKVNCIVYKTLGDKLYVSVVLECSSGGNCYCQ